MTDFDLREEGNRIAASWAIGEIEAPVALQKVCSAIQRCDASCAFVGVASADSAGASAPLFRELTKAAQNKRAFYTDCDSIWTTVVGAGIDSARYVVCEPARDGRGDFYGMLVVVGNAEKTRDSVLVALPRLARICGAIATREKQSLHVAKTSHTITNMLTGVVVNVEFAFELLGDNGNMSTADYEKLIAALKHARDCALRLAAHVDETKKLASTT